MAGANRSETSFEIDFMLKDIQMNLSHNLNSRIDKELWFECLTSSFEVLKQISEEDVANT
jgi:hypothetical protein